MFFTLSKLLVYVLYPIFWILVLLLMCCFVKSKKHQRQTTIAAIALLLIFSNTFLLNQFAKYWDIASYHATVGSNYSCALILGGYVSEDNTGKGFLNGSADRFIQGIKLEETGKVSHLLISGGSASLEPDTFIEGDWISAELKAFHIPDSTILVEKKSRNTLENIQFSKVILEHKHLLPPYLLVTSAFHMRRALLICQKAGIKVVAYPCNYFAGNSITSVGDFIPSAQTLANWNIYLKELIGYMVVLIKN